MASLLLCLGIEHWSPGHVETLVWEAYVTITAYTEPCCPVKAPWGERVIYCTQSLSCIQHYSAPPPSSWACFDWVLCHPWPFFMLTHKSSGPSALLWEGLCPVLSFFSCQRWAVTASPSACGSHIMPSENTMLYLRRWWWWYKLGYGIVWWWILDGKCH